MKGRVKFLDVLRTRVLPIIACAQLILEEKYAGPRNFLQTALLPIFTAFCSPALLLQPWANFAHKFI